MEPYTPEPYTPSTPDPVPYIYTLYPKPSARLLVDDGVSTPSPVLWIPKSYGLGFRGLGFSGLGFSGLGLVV